MAIFDKINENFVFTRNPVAFRLDATELFRYSLVHSESDVEYHGIATGPVDVNVSEVLEAMVSDIPDAGTSECVSKLCDVNSFKVTLEVHKDADKEADSVFPYLSRTFVAFKGGVSKRLFRELASSGSDIFKARFLKPAINFFMTVKGGARKIALKESELMPLIFLSPGECIEIEELLQGHRLKYDLLSRSLYALNIESVRKEFFTTCGVLPNLFNVYVDGVFSVRIGIEETPVSKERHLFKFRNRFGVFEMIDLPGVAEVAPGLDEDEEKHFQSYDSIVDDFTDARSRPTFKPELQIAICLERPGMLVEFFEMLLSDEVYWRNRGGRFVRVIPSTTDLAYNLRADSPLNFSLKIKMNEGDSVWNDFSDSEFTADGTRLFSEQFDDKFN